MRKLRSILTLTLAFGFFASVAFTSCGPKKEDAEDGMEQMEMEEPAELEQPTEVDTTTVPIEGDTTANPSN